MSAAPAFHIRAFGENGWLAQFESGGDAVALALYANAVADGLRTENGVIDSVAGIDSIAIRFNPCTMDAESSRDLLARAIRKARFKKTPAPVKKIEIPVCYGGAHGPDSDALCEKNELTFKELTEAHASTTYRVLMLGFAPGFAYMGPLSEKLNAPRLATPRARVAAGSVGVAGAFTGVYSLASPGGWNIIGRTPARLFDPNADAPFVFEPGAEVRFLPISEDEFKARAS